MAAKHPITCFDFLDLLSQRSTTVTTLLTERCSDPQEGIASSAYHLRHVGSLGILCLGILGICLVRLRVPLPRAKPRGKAPKPRGVWGNGLPPDLPPAPPHLTHSLVQALSPRSRPLGLQAPSSRRPVNPLITALFNRSPTELGFNHPLQGAASCC